MLIKRIFTIGFFSVALAGAFSFSYAQPSKLEMAKLIERMDLLDSMDFQDAIVAANNCTMERDFSCAERELANASQLATHHERRQALMLAEAMLEGEKELVSIEDQARELEEKLRQERLAEQEREREWQREQARKQRLAEERARRQRERQQAISLGVGLLAGAATVYGGGDSELGVQVMEQTSSGLYAGLSGDREAQLEYQRQTAAMEQSLTQFKVRQQAARQLQAERQREHEEMISRHEENMRISTNRPTVERAPSPAAAQAAQPQLVSHNTASTQGQIQQRAAEEARQQRAREQQAYEAQRMAEVEGARQRLATQSRPRRAGVGSAASTGSELPYSSEALAQQERASSSASRSSHSQTDSPVQSASNAPLATASGFGYDATVDDLCWDGRTRLGASCLVIETRWRTTISDHDVLLLQMNNICEEPLVIKWGFERRQDDRSNEISWDEGMSEIRGNSEKTRESLIWATGKWTVRAVGIKKPVNSMACSSRASDGKPAWIVHEGFAGK